MVYIAFLIIGAGAGGALIYFYLQMKLAAKITEQQLLCKSWEEKAAALQNDLFRLQELVKLRETDIASLQEEKLGLSRENSALKAASEEERKSAVEKLALLNEAKDKLSDAFKALSQDTLKSSNESFIQMAEKVFKNLQTEAKGDLEQRKQAVENLVAPIKEGLDKYQKWLQETEKSRKEDYGSLAAQIRNLAELEKNLSHETSNLVTALKAPIVRGSWGEQTLKRVVEMAGLDEYCDFALQDTVSTSEGRLRPDMVVRMPGGKVIIVDSKNIFHAYYEAMGTEDKAKYNFLMERHVRAIREHMKKLSDKSYWEQYKNSADYVIFFMPNENLYTEALRRDPQLLDDAVTQRILLAHPVSLVGFLRIVAMTWNQQKMSENTEKIRDLGRELYERIAVFAEHMSKVGSYLDKTVDSYNKAVASMESRVLTTAKKFDDMGISGKSRIEDVEQVDKTPRQSIVRVQNDKSLP